MALKLDLSDGKKDFVAGLIALIFVVTAGYLALNRFNNKETVDLGTGGSSDVVGETSSDSTVNVGTVAGVNSVFWEANDYEMGDIQTGSYTVVSGDTLWEIAEASYGDGTRWVEILNANSDSIGYLPDGSQAEIYVDQVLLIP